LRREDGGNYAGEDEKLTVCTMGATFRLDGLEKRAEDGRLLFKQTKERGNLKVNEGQMNSKN